MLCLNIILKVRHILLNYRKGKQHYLTKLVMAQQFLYNTETEQSKEVIIRDDKKNL